MGGGARPGRPVATAEPLFDGGGAAGADAAEVDSAASWPDLATELALLVRDGPKRATASLLSEFEGGPDATPMSRPGDLSVILDGKGSPVCVIRTTEVETRRFGDVDEQFAWDEGEGDRTLEWWRRAHIWVFERRRMSIGR